MYICNALFKHGYSNFSLEILEYCEPYKCLEREDYYQTKLNPEYNIAKKPGAPMSGHTHSEESKKNKKYQMLLRKLIILVVLRKPAEKIILIMVKKSKDQEDPLNQ
jgi:group I intron endonuclease